MLPSSIKGSVFSQDDKFLTNLVDLPPIDVMNNPTSSMGGSSEHGVLSTISYVSKEPITIIAEV